MMIFPVRTDESTNAEILRIHGLQTPNVSVPIEPVNFKKEVVPVQTPVVQEPIDIPPEPIEQVSSLQERFRERFGGIRARFQGRVGDQNRPNRPSIVEDFLISRQRRF